jgi:hypothetical protein
MVRNGAQGESERSGDAAMKTYDEIKRVLVEELGFRDLEAYGKWVKEVRPTLSLTPSRLEKLSPDVVDCRDFWKVCQELFGSDPVSNIVIAPEVGSLPYPIETTMDANRMNLRLARSLGITAFLEENAHRRLKTLEIGPGYGALRSFIETHTAHIYTGVDVFPRIPGVMQTTADGVLPASFVEEESGEYSYVVSSNVFQHLSARQRTKYIEDANALLHVDGLFIFNLLVDTAKTPRHSRDKQGNAWADHYGQYTPIPKGGVLYEQLARSFDILYVTQRYDGLFNFVCQKQ